MADSTRTRRTWYGSARWASRSRRSRAVGDNPNHPLHTKVLVYHINRNPYFRTDNPAFVPKPATVFNSENWQLNLPADDPDPYYDAFPATPRGNASTIKTLRRSIRV